MYKRVHEALAEKVTNPDLIIYLRSGTDVLMPRIAQRDRAYERNMERAYIERLNQAYDDFYLKGPHTSPVLTIEAGTFDFLNRSEDLRWIENRIRQELHMAPFQPELPLEGLESPDRA